MFLGKVFANFDCQAACCWTESFAGGLIIYKSVGSVNPFWVQDVSQQFDNIIIAIYVVYIYTYKSHTQNDDDDDVDDDDDDFHLFSPDPWSPRVVDVPGSRPRRKAKIVELKRQRKKLPKKKNKDDKKDRWIWRSSGQLDLRAYLWCCYMAKRKNPRDICRWFSMVFPAN